MQRSKRIKILTLFLTAATLLMATANLISGSEGIIADEITAFFDGDAMMRTIVYELRLPRTVAAVLCGALLGVSGALMQGALRNPLASPLTLGISNAAAFGAAFAIIVLQVYKGDMSAFGITGITSSAFISSLLALSVIMLLSKRTLLTPSAIILAGVAIGSLFHALTMFLQYIATDIDAAAVLFWTFGDLGKAGMANNLFMALLLLVSFGVIWRTHWQLDALGFGDESAKARGISVERFRLFVLMYAALLSAYVVSVVGIIGFVGLIAPHAVRLVIGNKHFPLLFLSMLSGAVLLLSADFAAKTVLLPSQLPVGILTSALGAPLFLYLLSRKKNRWI